MGAKVAMVRFIDLLYGSIELPDWVLPFIRLPEFIRLRGVRLSNVDSVYFKDFSGPTRWEHGIAVAALAYRCATRRGLDEKARIELTLAGLLHDVGTPPFAHTAESVLANFDHEIEGQRLLEARIGYDLAPDAPVFQSQLPQFRQKCERLSKALRVSVDPDEVARCTAGEGELGFLINGPIDLDNADNVTRSCLFLGLKVSGDVPLGVTDWLAAQETLITDLDKVEDESVRKWISYRDNLYTAFFEADESELGRMAFLQHLMRRGIDAGMGRSQFIWATDEGLMDSLSRLDDTAADDFRPALKELVQRYRLLETPTQVAKISIDDTETLRVLRHPDASAWVTKLLRRDGFEPMLLVMSRRFSANRPKSILPEPAGTLFVFQLGTPRKMKAFESRVRDIAAAHVPKLQPTGSVASLFSNLVRTWSTEKPWSVVDETRKRNVTAALKSVGDWGFRLSRNNGFHAYPSTFVHALPANLLVSLGIKDDVVLDTFGGTGQTAIEAVKYGNSCVTADVNSVACLVAKAKLTYLSASTREYIRTLNDHTVVEAQCVEPSDFQLIDKWFHPKTRCELGRLVGFVQNQQDVVLQTFLSACVSAILPSCTARRGEQHGYFADNCPLPSDMKKPPYQPATKLFLEKVRQALSRAERLYGFIERQGLTAETELSRAIVKQVDVNSATPESYGLSEGQAGTIITSPPYLCMADYALGLRLSYGWLLPGLLKADFDREIGARRLRLKNKSDLVIREYCQALNSFANLARRVVRKGGFVAVVLGQPVARQYRDAEILTSLDEALKQNGFESLWHTDRAIHWHRNHGYARLKTERISVHVKV
jgi:hypothetical protein